MYRNYVGYCAREGTAGGRAGGSQQIVARLIKGVFGRHSAVDVRMQREWARTMRSWKW